MSSRWPECQGWRNAVDHLQCKLFPAVRKKYGWHMRPRFQSLAIPLSLSLALFAQGCALGSRVRMPIELTSDRQISVVRAVAHQKDGGIEVAGDVRRPDLGSGMVTGHLHVTARNAAGVIVASTDAPWGEFMNRRFRLAYFKAFLKVEEPGAIAAISVEVVSTPGS